MRDLLKILFCFLEGCLLSECIFFICLLHVIFPLSSPSLHKFSFISSSCALFIPQFLPTSKGHVYIFPIELQFEGRLFVAHIPSDYIFLIRELRGLGNNIMNFHVFITYLRKKFFLFHLCCSKWRCGWSENT